MSELATIILLFLPTPIAYYYGKLEGKKKGKVKTLIKEGSYPKGLLNENQTTETV